MQNIKKYLNSEIAAILRAKGYEAQDAMISQSNRPELSDYQCNIAMVLAKKFGQAPVEIAMKIAESIRALDGVADVRVDGPGFINIRLLDDFVSLCFKINAAEPSGRMVVIDYGGPNIAKELHVGHLRTAVIGQSLKHIMRACGDTVVGDVHFGDWGTPYGMLITQTRLELPNLPYFSDPYTGGGEVIDIAEISAMYRRASATFKENDEFKEAARQATFELQNGHKGYRALWEMFRDVSHAAVRKNYDMLGVDFELWLGESDVNDLLAPLTEDLLGRGIAVNSDGAVIVPFAETEKKERAPLILRKSDGAYTYAATDIATIINRARMQNPDSILYVVDVRQKEHFEQVFEVVRRAEYVRPEVSLEHLANGTVNGKDGKPFKTRSGRVMNLEDLLNLALETARANLPAPNAEYSAEDLERQARQIAIAVLKYQDLKNNRASDYIFDTENFTKFEGKTGPYIQYAVARINSILAKKTGDLDMDCPAEVVISHPTERELMLALKRYPEALDEAYARREPSIIAEYSHGVAQKFNSFYAAVSVANEPDAGLRESRFAILEMTKSVLVSSLWLLGIEAPEKMLRAELPVPETTAKIS